MESERAYQFFRLVERMRDKQKEYFRTRSAAVLNESKHLERDVDKEIQRVNNVLDNRQPSLFGTEITKKVKDGMIARTKATSRKTRNGVCCVPNMYAMAKLLLPNTED